MQHLGAIRNLIEFITQISLGHFDPDTRGGFRLTISPNEHIYISSTLGSQPIITVTVGSDSWQFCSCGTAACTELQMGPDCAEKLQQLYKQLNDCHRDRIVEMRADPATIQKPRLPEEVLRICLTMAKAKYS